MANKLILILLLLSIVSCTSNKIITQKNYKGGSKHKQPTIKSLPKETHYIFDQELNDTLKVKLNQQVDELFNKYDIAGITATVLIPTKGIWETNRGFVSKPDNIVIDSSSVFYWASVSKLITSTLIYQLVLEDTLSFNDKLSKWFPNIQYSREITIEQLLTHTSGIYSFNSDSTVHFSNKHFTPDELLGIARSKKNLFKPGEYWSYTNTGYLLLALITEKIESKPFSQIVQEKLSIPLNLKTLKTATKNSPNLALAHKKDSAIPKDYSIPLGAGNVTGSSKDMAIFLSALLTGKIIPIKDVHTMMKDLYPMFNKGQYYGKGIMLYDFTELDQTNNRWIGHSGGTENYKAIVAYDIETKAIITISINENMPVEAIAYKLMELIKKHD